MIDGPVFTYPFDREADRRYFERKWGHSATRSELDDELRARIKPLREMGMSWQAIAEKEGISKFKAMKVGNEEFAARARESSKLHKRAKRAREREERKAA